MSLLFHPHGFRGHEYEVQRWLGLVPHDPPEGLHGERRGNLIARHTRFNPRKGIGIELTKYQRALMQAQGIPRSRIPMVPGGSGHWLSDALAKTYPRNREMHILSLLKPQRLDDRLWRWVYALMVTGGPLKLPELYAFVTRLTGPRERAQAEAIRRYQQWNRRTYERD